MKGLFKFLKWFTIIVVLLLLSLLITGNTHLIKGVSLTYLRGKTGPTIDDYTHFKNNPVQASATPQLWPIASTYNKTPLKAEDEAYHQQLQSVAYLVIKDGSIAHESYWDGYSDSSLTNSFSAAKSIVSVLIGCALQDGLIKDINEPAATYLPTYKDVLGDKITIRNLLTMSSGINFDESYGDPFGMMAKAYYGSNIPDLVKEYRPETEAGKQFNYLGGNTLLLGFIVEKVTGKKLAQYATEKLWQPMGAKNTALWTSDNETGSERSYCCFYSNARDFARIGKLYLDSGRWNGTQIVPQQYVLESTKPASDVLDGNAPLSVYGYQWWCYDNNGEHIFYARGIKGQYIIVRPEKNIIIVRLGRQRDKEKQNGTPLDVPRWIAMSDYLQ